MANPPNGVRNQDEEALIATNQPVSSNEENTQFNENANNGENFLGARSENQGDIIIVRTIVPTRPKPRPSARACSGLAGVAIVLTLIIIKIIIKANRSSSDDDRYVYTLPPPIYTHGNDDYPFGENPYFKTIPNSDSVCETFACKDAVQEIVKSMNTSVDPCDNFYEFACQGWQKNNPRPRYMSSLSTFSKLDLKSEETVRQILEQSVKYGYYDYGYSSTAPDSLALRQAKQFYRACKNLGSSGTSVNSEAQDKAALKPMLKTLEEYGGWPMLYEPGTWNSSQFDWTKSVVDLKRRFGRSLLLDINVFQSPDGDKTENMIVIKRPTSLSGGKNGLVQISELDRAKATVLSFQSFIVNVSRELLIAKGEVNINETYLEEQALEILFVQSEISDLGEELVDEKFKLFRGINDTMVEMPLDKMQLILDMYALWPGNELDLEKLLNTLYAHTPVRIAKSEMVFFADVDYLLQLALFLSRIKPEVLANYLHFQMAFQMTSMTTKKMQGFLNEMASSMDGTVGQRSRASTCATIVQKKFPHVLGQAYVKKRYPSITNSLSEFAEARQIFSNVRQSLLDLLSSSVERPFYNKTILSAKTAYTGICLGHPSWIYNDVKVQAQYSGLVVTKQTFLEQSLQINAWSVDKELRGLRESLDTLTDECKWTRFPGSVGAYNEIMRYLVYLPAGIIQYPFFNVEFPSALNYGKLGTVLGHEITHGLAGSGWTTYKNGSLTPTAECYANQYSNYTTDELRGENVTLNGMLTLNENIPDNAGLLEAYKAYKAFSTGTNLNSETDSYDKYDVVFSKLFPTSKFKSSKNVEGLEKYTEDQLFFLGFAQNFCESTTPESMRRSLQNDDHSPGRFRVLGTLKNSKEFAQAWNCPVGSQMNPAPEEHDKCSMF